MNVINCQVCGKQTHAYKKEKKYCSPKCNTKAYRLRHGLPLTWQKDSSKTHNYDKVRIKGLKPLELCPAMNEKYMCVSGSCPLGGQTFGSNMEKQHLKDMGCACMQRIF
jgi:ribosomal protein L37E